MSTENQEQKEKLLQLVQEALQRDSELREKHQVGEKFRFIRDRLQALLHSVKENLAALKKSTEETSDVVSEDDMLVYVYLYNAQGIVMQTWQKMLQPSVYYEYSVNRPVYMEKSHIEAFIRAKPNKVQHGYLTVAVKKSDVVIGETKDPIGHPLVKVKEGALHSTRMITFTHNNNDYVVNEANELVKAKKPLA